MKSCFFGIFGIDLVLVHQRTEEEITVARTIYHASILAYGMAPLFKTTLSGKTGASPEFCFGLIDFWRGWGDINLRPHEEEATALINLALSDFAQTEGEKVALRTILREGVLNFRSN